MKRIYYISFAVVILISCSKEEDIPFKDSVNDSINVSSYKKISGIYEGKIKRIEFVNSNSYFVIDSTSHTMEIEEISFDKVLCLNVSSDIESNAEADLFRFNQAGGYLRFLPYSMPDSTGIDTVFNGLYNGIYYYQDQSLEYFMYYIEQSDTIHQFFEGKIK